MQARIVLIYLAIICKGDWNLIKDCLIKNKCPDGSPYPEAEVMEKEVQGIKAITLLDEEYPQALKNSYMPPLVLFYEGNLELLKNDYKKNLAVIGSRKLLVYTDDGIHRLLEPLIGKYTIVSGLALGTDAIAHTSALDYNGQTIAVIASGLDICYPACNKPIVERILKRGGLILSEYPLGTQPAPTQFLMRNRIIVGLCAKVLIVEIRERSGTFAAVQMAISGGRDVYVCPTTLQGTLPVLELYNDKLIAQGALIYSEPSDLDDE